MRIQLRVLDLPHVAEVKIPTYGRQQNFFRGLLIAQLPDDGRCFSGGDVLRFHFPLSEATKFRRNHSEALRRLASRKGINEGDDPGPSNVDLSGQLLRKPNSPEDKQPPKWTRRRWWEHALSDEIRFQVYELNEAIRRELSTRPPGTTVWCDTETIELFYVEPCDVAASEGVLTPPLDVITSQQGYSPDPQPPDGQMQVKVQSDAVHVADRGEPDKERPQEHIALTVVKKPLWRAPQVWGFCLAVLCALWLVKKGKAPSTQQLKTADAPDAVSELNIADYVRQQQKTTPLLTPPQMTMGEIAQSWRGSPASEQLISRNPPGTLMAFQH